MPWAERESLAEASQGYFEGQVHKLRVKVGSASGQGGNTESDLRLWTRIIRLGSRPPRPPPPTKCSVTVSCVCRGECPGDVEVAPASAT